MRQPAVGALVGGVHRLLAVLVSHVRVDELRAYHQLGVRERDRLLRPAAALRGRCLLIRLQLAVAAPFTDARYEPLADTEPAGDGTGRLH